MYDNIAILISGAFRDEVPKDMIFNVIDNLKEQFSFFKKIDIYLTTWTSPKEENTITTWKPPNSNEKTVYYRKYDNEFLDTLKSKVNYLYIVDRPNYDSRYLIKNIQNTEQSTPNIFRMFYGMNILCENLNRKYDFICRCRNDLIIKGDFKQCIDNIISGRSEYEASFSYWTMQDCINDHFCITIYDNFIKVWKNDSMEIYRMIIEWSETAEKMTLFKLNENRIKYNLFLPSYYLFKNRLWVKDSKVMVNNLNKYIIPYFENYLKINYNLKLDYE